MVLRILSNVECEAISFYFCPQQRVNDAISNHRIFSHQCQQLHAFHFGVISVAAACSSVHDRGHKSRTSSQACAMAASSSQSAPAAPPGMRTWQQGPWVDYHDKLFKIWRWKSSTSASMWDNESALRMPEDHYIEKNGAGNMSVGSKKNGCRTASKLSCPRRPPPSSWHNWSVRRPPAGRGDFGGAPSLRMRPTLARKANPDVVGSHWDIMPPAADGHRPELSSSQVPRRAKDQSLSAATVAQCHFFAIVPGNLATISCISCFAHCFMPTEGFFCENEVHGM